jgi:L-ascorbate metabolism protein UlaG (beta-lactamase superfamily)
VVPSGVARWFASQSIGPTQELDWGDSVSLGPVTITAVPALHFSARTPFDRNRTLWCGYIIESRQGVVYFAGDTAFGNHFEAIRQSFGQPRVALLPIGAYLPRWFMSPVHMSPEDAVPAAGILGSDNTIAIHHGTFQLADDAVDTAANQLRL